MSSQAVRNNITNSIRRVITDVKKKVIAEGKKKIMELKDELLSPDTIIQALTADINENSCSIEGRKKMQEKVQQLNNQLDSVDEIAQEGLGVMTNLEEKIGSISSKIELPNGPNPIDNIKEVTDAIKPLTEMLRYVIMAAPAILGASSGPAANGAVIANTNNGVNLAKAKISEFTNLFTSLPRVLDGYIARADVVFDNITKIKFQIQKIVDEIDKLRAFIIYMELDFIDKCNDFNAPVNPPIPDPPIINPVPPPLTLEDVIAQSEELYGKILEDLISRGDNLALKRVYTLGVQLQRIKNIQIKIINI